MSELSFVLSCLILTLSSLSLQWWYVANVSTFVLPAFPMLPQVIGVQYVTLPPIAPTVTTMVSGTFGLRGMLRDWSRGVTCAHGT